MKRCVVLRHREDPWYLESQREAVNRLYGCPVLVVGYPDRFDDDVDIELDYTEGNPTCWPFILYDTARRVIEMFPEETLFLEGDMIPNHPMKLVPTIRDYNNYPWPGIIYTGDARVDTSTGWNVHNMPDITRGFEGLTYVRTDERFDIIGNNGEFLHPQAGCRCWGNKDKIKRFRAFVESRQQHRMVEHG